MKSMLLCLYVLAECSSYDDLVSWSDCVQRVTTASLTALGAAAGANGAAAGCATAGQHCRHCAGLWPR
eukprot:gene10548-biopygen9582